MYIALIDCNNFFVSCERACNPKLEGKPVVVVSSTDGVGIVLARSQEAKKLQIPMGAPTFQCEAIFKKYGVSVLPCQFSLYAALSHQVMELLKEFSPDVEVYSVDEAFISLDRVSEEMAFEIKQRILDVTKIPVSIGIAKTKTLCKAATFFAKKGSGVCFMQEEYLKELPIEEIWGIGRKLSERLRKKSIFTAFEFMQLSDDLLKREFSVVGLRTALELRGVPCFSSFEGGEARKSISTARAFKKPLTSQESIARVLASYTANIALELRQEKKLASMISVWLQTNLYGIGEKYADAASYVFTEPTAYTPAFVDQAKKLLQSIYKEGLTYKKVGVMLSNFVSENEAQLDLFELSAPKSVQDKNRLMKIVDTINGKFGDKTIRLGGVSLDP
ncbi:MAG: Protein umuC [Chlamydiia bacterium]|nr:Protein umuC [Chlamydiia bacterium]